MTGAEWFRDTTQIVLPKAELEGHCGDLKETFTVTVRAEGDTVRIIGSPVVIADVREWLSARGISAT